MSLVYAAIIPHGEELLPIHPPMPALAALTRSLHTIGEELRAASPQLLVICSPHHLRVRGHLAIADSAYLEGGVSGSLGRIGRRVRTDRPANRAIAAAAERCGLPAALCGYATAEDSERSCLPLDWGSLVPLHFIGEATAAPVAVLGPPRDLGLAPLRRFGQALRTALPATRFALIASADLAHAHDAQGPYGYDSAAGVYDAAVRNAVEVGDLSRLGSLADSVVAAARADAPWQLAVLEGALGRPHPARHAAYARPSYFGMLGAGYAVKADNE